jgi:WD40 repeat protein
VVKYRKGMTYVRKAMFLTILMFFMTLAPLAAGADSDGDGFDDSVDDCRWAYGTSSIDKDGCPDSDGDGTSDINDKWTTNNPNFQNEFTISSNQDYLDVDYSPDGEFVTTASENGFVRIWNASTHVNIRSVLAHSNNGEVTSVSYSPDGMYVAAGLDDDTMDIYYSSNLTSVHGSISVDVGSGDYVYDVEFSPDSTLVAVSIGRSGNGGTNGQVKLIKVSDGLQLGNGLNPNSEDRFEDAAFSPGGEYIALASDDDFYIVDIATRATTYSVSSPPANVNAIAWSPDGNYIAMCGGWEGNQASFDMYEFSGSSWTLIWQKTITTSCASTDFSYDSSQVVAGMYWYLGDANSGVVYDSDSGVEIDRFNGPRPGGCGGNDGCGQMNGIAWSPDSTHIVTAHGRGDEGLYFWYADLDEDNDGYNTTDQGDGVVDAFPSEGSQWDDSDNDGYGDNPAPAFEPDACVAVAGTSTEDRFGCPDADGDGWSDDGDEYPADPLQWADSDSDGYGDNYYFDLNGAQLHMNQSGDAFPNDVTQWNDTDGDGYGDNYVNASWDNFRGENWPGLLVSVANNIDTFPLDRTQWADTDGDWVGDEQMSDRADGCPSLWGDSQLDRLGCPDTDGDGWSDPDAGWPATTDCYGADAFPDDPTQWCDEDNDGFGSNQSGNNADECPNQAGTSSIDRIGCADRDGDGYSNAGDPFPDDGTQWADRDGDNRGDNPNGTNPDAFPDDSSQWVDADNDGYGDNPGGFNGDAFPNDGTQWDDTDGDGFGDNFVDADGDGVSEGNSDVCPTVSGNSLDPTTRGCTDSDQDGFVDPVDVFPTDPFQWADADGDGWGDNTGVPSGDDCVDVYGKSYENNRHGCPDADFDGWADVDDVFPYDTLQWKDTDGDGWGDNYDYFNETIADLDNPGQTYTIRNQTGDAFPTIADQWSDMDGDGWGDNQTSFYQPDAFPFQPSQWNDFDGDGYGDNSVFDPDGEDGPFGPETAFQPDECRKEFGTSVPFSESEGYGCPDSDGDGRADSNDICPWDPAITNGVLTGPNAVTCAITSDPNLKTDDGGGSTLGFSTDSPTFMALSGLIVLLLGLIFVAQIAKASSKRKASAERAQEVKMDLAFSEEEERRLAWIDHYVAAGQLDEARALGWTEAAAVPEWKQYEMQQQAAQEGAVPTMLDLNKL